MKRKKMQRINLRLTEEDYATLKKLQSRTHLSMSEFCRRLLLGQTDTVFTKENYQQREEIRNFVQWTSGNVNQVAKALNGILERDRRFELTPSQVKIVENLKTIIARWSEAKKKIL